MHLHRGTVGLLGLALLLAACTSDGQSTPMVDSPSASAGGTLRVWLMDSSQPASIVEAVKSRFATAYPKVEVEVERLQWSGIQEALDTALASQTPPDVVEIGNSATARYADEGLLAELDPAAFGVEGMLPGLVPSGELDGTRYGIPYYGGVRVVVYKRSDFEKAGVKVPGTMAELERVAAALQKANADNGDYSAFYFPGRFWYGALPFIWDAGGEIAVQDGGQWTGALDSDGSRAGLSTLARLVDSYSKAPRDADERKNLDAFRTGDVGMMIDSWWVPGALNSVGEFAGDVGAFALPGSAAATAPAFLGGSDLAVAKGSRNKGLAVEWIKVLTGLEMQTELARAVGVIPNQEGAFAGHEGNPFLGVADEAARNSRFTPVSPFWGDVERAEILPDMLEDIFTGSATLEAATDEASQALTATLNR